MRGQKDNAYTVLSAQTLEQKKLQYSLKLQETYKWEIYTTRPNGREKLA